MSLLLAFQTAGLHCSGEDWRTIIGQWTRMPDSTEKIIVQRLNSKASKSVSSLSILWARAMCWILIQFEHFERLCQVEPSYWSSSIAGIAFGSTRFILWSLALSPCRPPLRPNHVSAHRCSTLLHAANPSKFELVPVHARARSTVALPHPCKCQGACPRAHAREIPEGARGP